MTLEALAAPEPAVRIEAGRRPEAGTHVRIESFDGPLALLLALIESRRLDVLTVPLGALADAYLDAVAALDADRLGHLSAFVTVASQLILIKSRALLPRQEDVPAATDADEDALPTRQVGEQGRFARSRGERLEPQRAGVPVRVRAGEPERVGRLSLPDYLVPDQNLLVGQCPDGHSGGRGNEVDSVGDVGPGGQPVGAEDGLGQRALKDGGHPRARVCRGLPGDEPADARPCQHHTHRKTLVAREPTGDENIGRDEGGGDANPEHDPGGVIAPKRIHPQERRHRRAAHDEGPRSALSFARSAMDRSVAKSERPPSST